MPRHTLHSDVTGKVWQITAAPGSHVASDEPILIIESMKMEIPVTAPFSARMVECLVAEGDLVEEGQAVAMLEPA
jgi:acetyl-CoA carboxylase biotin carboxyl carrier protein